jgi:RNA polymerase sigma-70 factor (ECF subfamily)
MERKEHALADEDAHLVLLCKKGDVDAFEELVRKHQKMMINIAYRMLTSYEDACEIVQDAFISAYKGMHNFEGKSKFSTWICAIVVNLSKNRLKQLKKQEYYEDISFDDPGISDKSNVKTDPSSVEPSAIARLEQQDLQQQVHRCISALDIELKEVVILRDIQNFSYEEISAMLKIPDGTVKSRLYRARHDLKDCLKKILGVL